MTVILGVRTDKTVVVAGDKRGTNIIENKDSDNLKKVTPINNHLCMASAGNLAISKAIKMEIEKIPDKSEMVIEDIIKIIQDFYERLYETNSVIIMSYQAAFIVGGLKGDGNTGLYAIYNHKGQLEITEIQDLGKIIPPDGMSEDEANSIFAFNLNKSVDNYIENTINDISKANEYVSPNGDKWVYNKQYDNSEMISFEPENKKMQKLCKLIELYRT